MGLVRAVDEYVNLRRDVHRGAVPEGSRRSQTAGFRRAPKAAFRRAKLPGRGAGNRSPCARQVLSLTFLLASGFRLLTSPFLLTSGFWLLAASRACLRRQRGLRAGFPASPVNPGGFACRRLFRENLSSVAEPKSDFALIHALDAPNASLEDHAFGGGPGNDRRRVNPRNGRTTEEKRDDRGNENEGSHQSPNHSGLRIGGAQVTAA